MDDTGDFVVPPSTAARPDLDWSQVRETIQMLNLADRKSTRLNSSH